MRKQTRAFLASAMIDPAGRSGLKNARLFPGIEADASISGRLHSSPLRSGNDRARPDRLFTGYHARFRCSIPFRYGVPKRWRQLGEAQPAPKAGRAPQKTMLVVVGKQVRMLDRGPNP